jgi:hypothetical protein
MIKRCAILALTIVLAVACAYYWLTQEIPSERNRFRHPQAYSVCIPSGWSAEIQNSGNGEQLAKTQFADGLVITPDQYTGRRPALAVGRLAGTPDPVTLHELGWLDGTFRGEPAYVIEKRQPHAFTRTAVFQLQGVWFDVNEWLPVDAVGEKDKWWKYLETLRYPDGTPAKPQASVTSTPVATQPVSTQPFTFP